jgi:hypothetical protein
MKVFKLLYLILFCSLFLSVTNIFAQTADTLQTTNPIDQGDIIEAGEAIIKIEVEKPQVQLFSQRIKPEFDEVNLEKSFLKEILDEGQVLTIESLEDKETDRIDIKKLLNRNR